MCVFKHSMNTLMFYREVTEDSKLAYSLNFPVPGGELIHSTIFVTESQVHATDTC